MSNAKQKVLLLDSESNPTTAVVDDITLERGGDPQSLTASQIDRLKETGVALRTVNEKE